MDAQKPLAQLPQTPERPTPAQNAHNHNRSRRGRNAALQTDLAQETTTSATDTTPMNAASTQNKTEPPRQPTLEDVRAVLAPKVGGGPRVRHTPLLDRYGAKKLSAVDPARYAELLRAAEAL